MKLPCHNISKLSESWSTGISSVTIVAQPFRFIGTNLMPIVTEYWILDACIRIHNVMQRKNSTNNLTNNIYFSEKF